MSDSQSVRVVKELDLKSNGVTRAGSNPAADEFFAHARERILLRKSRYSEEMKESHS